MTAVGDAARVLGAFETPDRLLAAIRGARREGFGIVEAYAPFKIEGLSDALGLEASRLRPAMLAAGLVGGALGLGLQLWSAAFAYPINSGGRPFASLPAFVPIAFEFAIGFAALAGFAGFLIAGRLTRLHDPIFAAAPFERASADRFLLQIAANAAQNAEQARSLLMRLGAEDVVVLAP